MSENIFADHAPRHWQSGLPVIPLQKRDKMPIPRGWSQFHQEMPGDEDKEKWLQAYPDGNLGLVLGEQSGLMMIDIDTPDENLRRTIMEVLESVAAPSPWKRIGQKGCVLAYRFNGLKTFRVKTIEGDTILEGLSSRTQVVLPPSIHPKTNAQYQANCELIDVLDDLPTLPRDIETILRQALQEEVELSTSGWTRTTDYISRGARDTQMTRIGGLFAHGVTRGELSVKEAIERIHAWYETCTEQVVGDEVDPSKGVQNMVTFLQRDVISHEKPLPTGWDEGLSEEEKQALALDFDKESHEEWTYEQLKDYLVQEFENNPPDSPGRTKAINYALKKVVRSPNLDKMSEERIVKFIADTSGSRLTLSALRRHLRDLRSGGFLGEDHSEIANEVLNRLTEFGEHRADMGNLYRWGGSHWVTVDDNEILQMIAREYGNLPASKKSNDHYGILRTLKTLAAKPLQQKTVNGVNFVNGFLTEDMKLLDHDPDFGMTYTLPFPYRDELKDRPFRFMDFLYQCWGEDPDCEEKILAIQEAICVTLFGMGPKFERAICLHGVAKSGKSQLLRVVSSIVPEEGKSSVNPGDWSDKFAPAQMADKIINVCGELSDRRQMDGQKFKQIISGEEMMAQHKNMAPFNFVPTCTHWFATNHLPRSEDTSEGFTRRWLFLDFRKAVKNEDRVLDLGALLVAEEREAIVAWAVQAMGRLRRNRDFTLPRSHIELANEVANINNSVRFFLLESGRVQVDTSSSTPISENELHNAYWSFCAKAGVARPASLKIFRQKMRDLAPELGFTITSERDQTGNLKTRYKNITFAGVKAA